MKKLSLIFISVIFSSLILGKNNTILIGRILDSETKLAVDAKIQYLKFPEEDVMGLFPNVPPDGHYEVKLEKDHKYIMQISAQGYETFVDTIVFEPKDTLDYDFFLTPHGAGQTLHLSNLIFDKGSYVLKYSSEGDLDLVVSMMKAHPHMTIRLDGHTDYEGNEKQNMILGQNRIDVVKTYLVNEGVASKHIKTKCYGGKKPIVVSNSMEERKVNRRVDVVVLKR